MRSFILWILIVAALGCGKSTSTLVQEQEIRDKGFKSGKIGQPPEANPYTSHDNTTALSPHTVWAEGWIDGDAERRKEEAKAKGVKWIGDE